ISGNLATSSWTVIPLLLSSTYRRHYDSHFSLPCQWRECLTPFLHSSKVGPRGHSEIPCESRDRAPAHQPTDRRDQSLPPPPPPPYPVGLCPGGRGAPPPHQGGESPDPPQHRLLHLPLVPRHGARVVRGRVDRRADEQALRLYQGRSRGAPRPR